MVNIPVAPKLHRLHNLFSDQGRPLLCPRIYVLTLDAADGPLAGAAGSAVEYGGGGMVPDSYGSCFSAGAFPLPSSPSRGPGAVEF